MGMESHFQALIAAEELDGSALAVVTDAPKPLIDWELAELGRAIKLAQGVKHQADRAVRLLEEEQSRRIAELNAAGGNVERYDAGNVWFVKYPQPKPSLNQLRFLAVFQRCLDSTDALLITDCFNLCKSIDAHMTSWRTDSGEALDVAYARRMKELEAV